MAPFPVTSSADGVRITLNEFLKQPSLIREVVLSMANQSFLADAVLRNAGTTPSGLIRYRESSPLYADTDVQTRAEFAEVAVGQISLGKPMIALVEEKALAAVISDEMVRRMNIDMLRTQLERIRNTMRRSYDRTLFRVLTEHPRVQRHVVPTPWDDPTAKHRIDLWDAKRLVSTAAPDGMADSEFGFEPDTLIIGRDAESALFASDEFNKVYLNSPQVTEAPIYRGQLPNSVYGLTIMVTPLAEFADKAVIMQRNVAGFIADELPLTVSDPYRIEERKMSRADVQRASAVGLDQPKAVVVLEGIAA